jgi:hypothetical protein
LAGGPEVNVFRDILSELQTYHCPELRELKFRGLMIKEGWNLRSSPVLLPLTITILALMVVGARFTFGDWGVAWTFGAFFVALLGVSGQWLKYAVER